MRRWLGAIAVAGVAACGGSKPETKPVEEPEAREVPEPMPHEPDRTLPPGPCIPAATTLAGVSATATDDGVSFCLVRDWPNEGGPEITPDCWTVDFASGALTAGGGVPPFGPFVPPFSARVNADTHDISVCPNGPQAVGCVTRKPKLAKGEVVTTADVDDANGRLAYVVEKLDGGVSRVVVETMSDGKRLASFPFGDASSHCGQAQFVGEAIVVSIGNCAGPTAIGEIHDAKGKLLARVGPAPATPDEYGFDMYGYPALPLGNDEWAFLSSNGTNVVVQNVKTGKVTKSIDVAAASSHSITMDNPGTAGWTRTPAGKLVIVDATPNLGGVYLVDPQTGTARVAAQSHTCQDEPK